MIISSTSLCFTVSMARLDELGAVVGGDHLDALRASEGLSSSSFAFTRSMTLSAFSPWRITTMPPTTSPSAVEVGDAAAHLRAQRHRGHVLARSIGVPPSVLSTMLLDVVGRLDVAAAAHHVLARRTARRAVRRRRCCRGGRPRPPLSSGRL